MKRVMVGLLCFMLAAGIVSGCGKEAPKTDNNQGKTEETKDKEETASQDTEKKEEEQEAADEKTEKTETEMDEKPETDNSAGIEADDLTMEVLKNQAGTRDYTSLEELNPEPGSHIAVVVKSTKTGFWNTVKKGMDAAVKDLNEKMGYKGDDKIKLSFEGPSDEKDVESQINIIDAVLTENPTVLCLAAIDMESCEAQVEAATDSEIPVIVLDSGVESDLVSVVCAIDNYKAGTEAAKKLAEALGDKGKVAVMTHVESAETSQEREKGFTDEITANHPEIEIVNISHENAETSMAEMAEAVFKLYPEVKGYYCTNEIAANDVLDAVDAAGKDVTVISFDSGKKQNEAVRKGKELGVFVQNAYGMGYATIIAGVRADRELENDALINPGYQWIDSSNIDLSEYSNYLYE